MVRVFGSSGACVGGSAGLLGRSLEQHVFEAGLTLRSPQAGAAFCVSEPRQLPLNSSAAWQQHIGDQSPMSSATKMREKDVAMPGRVYESSVCPGKPCRVCPKAGNAKVSAVTGDCWSVPGPNRRKLWGGSRRYPPVSGEGASSPSERNPGDDRMAPAAV